MEQNSSPGLSVPEGAGARGEHVGDIIRRERERRQISIEATAKTLRLNARYIEALEANNYDQLPGDTYIRVYLRSLSRFLSLDSEEIFQRFFQERGLTGADTLRKDSRTKINLTAQEEKKSDTPLIAIFSVIALLAVFSFLVNRHGCHSSPHHKNAAAAVDTVSKGKHGADKKTAEVAAPALNSQKANRTAADTVPPDRQHRDAAPPVQKPSAAVVKPADTLAKAKTAGIRPAEKSASDTVKKPAFSPGVPVTRDTVKPADGTPDSPSVNRNITDSPGKTRPLPAHARTDTGLMVLKMTVVGDSCWGRVISDGVKDWRKTLPNGKGMSFTASDSFNVHVGISDAVSFTLNGTPLGLPKRRGVVTFKVDRSRTVTLWPLEKWNSVFEKR
jgi:cytoskeleton protein RodZ